VTETAPLARSVVLLLDARVAVAPGTDLLVPPRAAREAWSAALRADPAAAAPAVHVAAREIAALAAPVPERPAWVASARRRVERAVEARATRAAGPVRSLVLGEAWRLDARERALLRNVGVSHLLAISGFNLALLAWVLGRSLVAAAASCPALLLRVDARRAVAALLLPAVWSTAAIVGWQPSVVRAALMISALLVARLLGRRVLAADALALAVVVVFVGLPDEAADAGFQLSLAAVGGLLLAQRYAVGVGAAATDAAAEPFRRRKPAPDIHASPPAGAFGGALALLARTTATGGRLVLRLLVFSTFAALATAPVAAAHFGTIAPAAPLANLIAIPLFTFLVYPAAVLTALLAAGPAPSWLVSAAAEGTAALWSLFVRLCGGLSRILPGTVEVGRDRSAVVALAAAGLALLLARSRAARRAGPLLLALAAVAEGLRCLAAGAGDRLPSPPPGAAEVVFLDAGDADAILVRLPDGRRVLVDAGGSARPEAAARAAGRVLDELARRGVEAVDLAIATHPHPDHVGGFIAAGSPIRFAEIWSTPQAEAESPDGRVARWLRERSAAGTKVRRTPAICGRHELGGATLEVLSPCDARGYDPVRDENENSLVVRLSVGCADVLLTGDAGLASETDLLARGAALEAEVLKAGHHGSRASTGEAFLDAVRPRLAVVTARAHGPEWRGPPHAGTFARLARRGTAVLWTGQDGPVTVHLSPDRVTAYDGNGERRGEWAARCGAAQATQCPRRAPGIVPVIMR
jgi:competence protein ComEC